MKHTGLFILFISTLLAGICPPAFAQKSYIATSTLDSTKMIQGSKTALTIEIAGPLSDNVRLIDFDTDSIDSDLEINRQSDRPTITELGNGRKQLRQIYTVQAFDSGLYVLPPVMCIDGSETIRTNAPVLKVEPVSLDSTNVIIDENGNLVGFNVNDDVTVVDDNYKFFDFMPNWVTNYWLYILLAVIVVALAIFVYMKWLRHGRIPLRPVKKQLPPYELAIKQLNQLQGKQLWQQGADKEYYTQLTDILRTYLNGRFGISAMEMTSPQIAEAIAANSETNELQKYVNEVLTQADFVKFAKARPQADENQRAFNNVMHFVENTKPVEQPAEQKTVAADESDGNDGSTTPPPVPENNLQNKDNSNIE